MMTHRQRDQTISWIADARHTGITHDRDVLSVFEVNNEFGSPLQFVVFVIADGSLLNAVVVQQLLSLAGVLAGNQVDFLQRAQGSQSNVFKISNGGSNQEENPGAVGTFVSIVT